MIEKNFDNNNENCIEWLTGQRTVTFSLTDRSWIRKIVKLKEKSPDDISYVTNLDGSICGKMPKKALKASIIKRVLTEEQQLAASERGKLLAAKLAENRKKKSDANK